MNNKYVINGLCLQSGLNNINHNTPIQYSNRKRQYFDSETTAFVEQYARYASNYIEAQAQGLCANDPLSWQTINIRMADIVKPSASIERNFDDYKIIIIDTPLITYIRPGTKFLCMGSTWLAVNPINIAATDGSAIVRRCNTVWNHLDWYGNILSEPIICENLRANANDSTSQDTVLLTKGYFNLTCQYNDYTSQLNTNSRLILGSAAYRITGFSDFSQEFTGDYSSIRLLKFTARYDEPNLEIDDMQNHIAEGKVFSWDINILGNSILPISSDEQLTAESIRNGVTVNSTDNNLITYTWESNNNDVATVDETGLVHAVSEGSCEITVTLEQNPSNKATRTVTVPSTQQSPEIIFLNDIPEQIQAYQSISVSAAYVENGEITEQIVDWNFSGAEDKSYSYVINGNTVEITCWRGSINPLICTAKYNDTSVTATIILIGI